MGRWVGLIMSTTLMSGWLYATPGLYDKVAALYYKAGAPNSKGLIAEAVWYGKCVRQETPDEKKTGTIFFHVDKDPVLGDSFYMVPHFHSPELPNLADERIHGLRTLEKGHIKTVVTFDPIEVAWSSAWGEGNYPEVTHLLKEGKTINGKQAFFLKVKHRDMDTTFCYYYLPMNSGMDASGTVVAPPPDPMN